MQCRGRRRVTTGQVSGHPLGLAFSWGQLVDQRIAERGSLAELARHILDIAPRGAGLSDDPQTTERGLRRLRQHGFAPANRYGRLLLRLYGVPRGVEAMARELGQYHSRMSDLSESLRAEQLRLWDRPPLSESAPVAIWLHIALATHAHRREDQELRDRRLELAELLLEHGEVAARCELRLFSGRCAQDAGDEAQARAAYDEVEAWLSELEGEERACYAARLADQRAYQVCRGWRGERGRLERGLACYEVIPQSEHPFVLFRRAHGRAWCLWKLGRLDQARACAEQAVEQAGDGGYRRFRAMALELRGHIEGGEGGRWRRRARAIEERLG